MSDSRAKIICAVEPMADEQQPTTTTVTAQTDPILPETPTPAVSEESPDASEIPVLAMLDDAEVYEPEFAEPEIIPVNKIPSKLLTLEAAGFFKVPRTVTETVQHLRENGWAASRLDVSKAMVAMAAGRKLVKNSVGSHACYTDKRHLILS